MERKVVSLRALISGGQRQPLLVFTALTVPGCVGLALGPDYWLARLIHLHSAGAVPLFAAFTQGADWAYGATMKPPLGLAGPMLFWGLGLAYLLGRWVLRWRSATALLITLLTHGASSLSANLLKVAVQRPRPAVLFDASSTASFSFPSGHTAAYWSLFLPLAVAFPRWRVPLLAGPVLIALGRLALGEHYLSDVWAAIWLAAAWTAFFGLLGRVAKPRGLLPAA